MDRVDKKRILWIDVAKGICMLAIIAGHFGVESINRIVFAFHIPVFFMLSGYTLSTNTPFNEQITKRFTKLMKPYFITCIFIFFFNVFNDIYFYHDNTIQTASTELYRVIVKGFFANGSISAFAGIDLGGFIGAIWFLPALFFSTLICRLLLDRVKKWSVRFIIAIAIMYAAIITARFIWLPFSVQSGMMGGLFMLFGKWLAEKDILDGIKWYIYIIFVSVCIVGFIFGFTEIHMASGGIDDYVVTPVVVLMASVIVLKLCQLCEKIPVIDWIGRSSLYILFVHTIQLDCMGGWYAKLFGKIGISDKLWVQILIYMVTAVIFAGMIQGFIFIIVKCTESLKEKFTKRTENKDEKNKETISVRDDIVDIYKAFLIIIMIVGHRTIDKGLWNVIYSFHMVAFVFLSGVFFKHRDGGAKELGRYILRIIRKTLIPYMVFALGYIILNSENLKMAVKTVILGMSYSDRFFADVPSIGPVYFILMLIVIRIIYAVVEHFIDNDAVMSLAVLTMSLMGLALGKLGFWLPWSIDCAFYAMAFYHMGYICKKYKVFDFLKSHNYIYFVLSLVWAFYLFNGPMELAMRKYSPYGLVAVGTIAAILVIYIWISHLDNSLSGVLKKSLSLTGQSTLYILIIHVLVSGHIHSLICKVIPDNTIYDMIAFIVVQLILGIIVNEIVKLVSKACKIK